MTISYYSSVRVRVPTRDMPYNIDMIKSLIADLKPYLNQADEFDEDGSLYVDVCVRSDIVRDQVLEQFTILMRQQEFLLPQIVSDLVEEAVV